MNLLALALLIMGATLSYQTIAIAETNDSISAKEDIGIKSCQEIKFTVNPQKLLYPLMPESLDSSIKQAKDVFMRVTNGSNVLNSKTIQMNLEKYATKQTLALYSSLMRYDENMDGDIERLEIKNSLYSDHQYGMGNPRDIELSINHLMSSDLDKDNKITKNEIKEYSTNNNLNHKQLTKPLQDALTAYDLNKDSEVTQQEVEDTYKTLFAEIDFNKDGKITKQEETAFKTCLKAASIPISWGIDKDLAIQTNDLVEDTLNEIKMIEAAVNTFRDKYSTMPGDMINAERRLPDCTPENCGSGNGDGFIHNTMKDGNEIPEAALTWIHLDKGSILPNRDPLNQQGYHPSRSGGAYYIKGNTTASATPDGMYIFLTNRPKESFQTPLIEYLTAKQAKAIDSKLDDGFPVSGSVTVQGNADCLSRTGSNITYNIESVPNQKCFSLYVKIR